MEWNKYTIKTTTYAADLVSGILMSEGITGIEVEDKVPLSQEDAKKMFIDILPDLGENDNISYLSFYIPEDIKENDDLTSMFNTGIAIENNEIYTSKNEESILNNIRIKLKEAASYCDLGAATISKAVVANEDWNNNWKKFFKPFEIDGIIIKPTWEEVEDAGKTVIQIDPGSVFGTGQHETTRLCIEQIRKYTNEDTIALDVGCGTGILAIIALKLGASRAVGTDIDRAAVSLAVENACVNGIAKDRFKTYEGNLIDDIQLLEKVGQNKYDLVIANILADVIIPLSGMITKVMKSGAVFISSGILETRKDEVLKAFAKNIELEVIDIVKLNDWISITARKK